MLKVLSIGFSLVSLGISSVGLAHHTCKYGSQEYYNRCNAHFNVRIHDQNVDFGPCFDGNNNANVQCVNDLLWTGFLIAGTIPASCGESGGPFNLLCEFWHRDCCTEGIAYAIPEAITAHLQKEINRLKADNEKLAEDMAGRLASSVGEQARVKINEALGRHKSCLAKANSTALVMDCFQTFSIELNSI